MKDNPCYNCQNRITPTPENPRTCHSDCEKYREFVEKIRRMEGDRRNCLKQINDCYAVSQRLRRAARKEK